MNYFKSTLLLALFINASAPASNSHAPHSNYSGYPDTHYNYGTSTLDDTFTAGNLILAAAIAGLVGYGIGVFAPPTKTAQKASNVTPQPITTENKIYFKDIFGQEQAIEIIKSVITNRDKNNRALLLEGPPGTGKTSIAQAIANELGWPLIEMAGSSFVEVFVGTGAQKVRELFARATTSTPAVIFIDEIDAAGSERAAGSSSGDAEYRQTTLALLVEIQKALKNKNILVVMATNHIKRLDAALKAPHRTQIVSLSLPNPGQRMELLKHYLSSYNHTISNKVLIDIIKKTRGFSQAQLLALIEITHNLAKTKDSPEPILNDIHLQDGLKKIRTFIKASFYGNDNTEIDTASFNDIAGLDDIITELKNITYGLKHPDHLEALGAKPPRGILLVGKPGCGKTMLARAIANEAGCTVLTASGGNLDSENPQKITQLFATAAMLSPSIIFIDEVDGIQSTPCLNELLVQMDGFTKNEDILVIGATNHPHAVDYRLRREGRFSRILNISTPTKKEREKILLHYIKKLPHVTKDIPLVALIEQTEGFNGSGIQNIVNDAALYASFEKASQVEAHHFLKALTQALSRNCPIK